MNPYVFFLLSVFCVNFAFSMDNPGKRTEECKNSFVSEPINAARESFRSVTPSCDLPQYPDEFCQKVLAGASEDIYRRAKLIINLKTRSQAFPFMIFHGPSGTGKTTMAFVIAQEMKRPFLFVKGASLATEYVNSGAAALVRISQKAVESESNIFIDEVDRVARAKKKGMGNEETDDNTPAALWQLLDHLRRNKLFFFGTSNDLRGLPEPLQRRIKPAMYEITYIPEAEARKRIILYCLRGKSYDNASTLEFIAQKTKGLSSGEIDDLIILACEKPLERDSDKILITRKDFEATLKFLTFNEKGLKRTKWEKEKVFQYTVQTVGLILNIINCVNGCVGLFNNFRSLEIAGTGLTNQVMALELQDKSVGFQERGLELQGESVEVQKEGLGLQKQSLECQKQGLELQKEGLNAQKTGLSMQQESLQAQKTGVKYQKWATNPIAFVYALNGAIWDGSVWTCSSVWQATKWIFRKTIG